MKIFNFFKQLLTLLKLEKKTLNLGTSSKGKEFYSSFTERHPKYFMFRRKTQGVALICFSDYDRDFSKYYASINGKNSAAYYSRKASGRGYVCQRINPNDYVDDIYEINVSKKERQGREMSGSYSEKKTSYCSDPNFYPYGIISSSGKLVSYTWMYKLGEVAVVNTLLGHGDLLNDGIMYLMISDIVKEMMNDRAINFVMYDTYFGALPGLKMFKNKLGFKPYRVKWITK